MMGKWRKQRGHLCRCYRILAPLFRRYAHANDGLKNRDAFKNELCDFVSLLDDEVIARMVEDYNLDLSGIVRDNDTGTNVNHVFGSKARAGSYSSVHCRQWELCDHGPIENRDRRSQEFRDSAQRLLPEEGGCRVHGGLFSM